MYLLLDPHGSSIPAFLRRIAAVRTCKRPSITSVIDVAEVASSGCYRPSTAPVIELTELRGSKDGGERATGLLIDCVHPGDSRHSYMSYLREAVGDEEIYRRRGCERYATQMPTPIMLPRVGCAEHTSS